MSKLSVVVTAYNEEKKIGTALESAKFADEIIVVDNCSTDTTAAIAKKFTKKIYQQENDRQNIDLQKNFGMEKATGDWVLVLDADEVITQALAKEIQEITTTGDIDINGYWIPRKNIIFGKWIAHSGWYPDYQLRLFRNGKGKFTKAHVHEPLQIEGRTEKLTENLLHHNYESIAQFLQRGLLQYAPNEAEELLRKGYEFDFRDAVRFPLQEFLSRYFARGGYKDGFHGLMLSLLMAIYHFVMFAYIWEKKDFVQDEDMSLLDNEFDTAKKELSFWFDAKKIEKEKNPLKKATIKLKRKMNL